MSTYFVDLDVVYNGVLSIEANDEFEAIQKADDYLKSENFDAFPDSVDVGDVRFTYGETIVGHTYECGF